MYWYWDLTVILSYLVFCYCPSGNVSLPLLPLVSLPTYLSHFLLINNLLNGTRQWHAYPCDHGKRHWKYNINRCPPINSQKLCREVETEHIRLW